MLWIADSTKVRVERLDIIISHTAYLLNEMAMGNFAVCSKIEEEIYSGDFRQLLLSMQTVKQEIIHTLSEINEGSCQVEAKAVQMTESLGTLIAKFKLK